MANPKSNTGTSNNIGLAKGLSYVNDWNADINRAYQREEYSARIKKQQKADVALWAERVKEGKASTPRGTARLNEFYKGLNKQLVDLSLSDPNYDRSVEGMAKFNEISDQFLDNDIIKEDLIYQKEREKLAHAVSTGALLEEQYEMEKQKYEAYENNTDPNAKVEPYTFTSFNEMNINKIAAETASYIPLNTLISRSTDYETAQKTSVWGASEDDIADATTNLLSSATNNLAFKTAFGNLNEAQQAQYDGSYFNFTKKMIKNSITNKRVGEGINQAVNDTLGEAKHVLLNGKQKLLDFDNANNNLEDGETMPSGRHDYVFTAASGKDPQGNYTVIPGDGALVMSPDGEFVDFLGAVSNNSVQPTTGLIQNNSIKLNLDGTGQWTKINGVMYLRFSTKLLNPEVEGTKGSHQYDKKGLAKAGFLQLEHEVGLGMQAISDNTIKIKGLNHTGDIYLPLTMSPEAMREYLTRTSGGSQKALAGISNFNANFPEYTKGSTLEEGYKKEPTTKTEVVTKGFMRANPKRFVDAGIINGVVSVKDTLTDEIYENPN